MSRLIEKSVLHHLLCHLDQNSFWHTFLSAYRPKHNTETALLRVVNDLRTASDSGFISILTLLELSAAFNTMYHNIVLIRLENTFGIGDLALSFFASYLQDRIQVVTVNEVKSSPSLLTCGVPQGSVLGPVLFILYIQPLSGVISHHSVSHYMFAHDTELYKSDFPSEAFTLARTIETLHFSCQLRSSSSE